MTHRHTGFSIKRSSPFRLSGTCRVHAWLGLSWCRASYLLFCGCISGCNAAGPELMRMVSVNLRAGAHMFRGASGEEQSEGRTQTHLCVLYKDTVFPRGLSSGVYFQGEDVGKVWCLHTSS